MAEQSKLGSVVETLASVASGFVIAVITQLIMFPFFNVHVTLNDNLKMTLIFTIVSIIRGYYVRRFFNWIQRNYANGHN